MFQPSTAQHALLMRTHKQLRALDNALDSAAVFAAETLALEAVQKWDLLSRAKERLFKVWAHLAQLAPPAPVKVQQRRIGAGSYHVQPVDEIEVVSSVSAAPGVQPAPDSSSTPGSGDQPTPQAAPMSSSPVTPPSP